MSFFRKDRSLEAATALYESAVAQARNPVLYTKFGVPDTQEGRFEMITLHVYAVMRFLKTGGREARNTSQKLFEVMFQNMDDSLRELGVGDLSIGRKIRTLAENFYGRLTVYEENLADRSGLAQALGRNIYNDDAARDAPALADYLQRLSKHIEAQPEARLACGIVHFVDVE